MSQTKEFYDPTVNESLWGHERQDFDSRQSPPQDGSIVEVSRESSVMFGNDRIHSPHLMSNSMLPSGPYFDNSYNQDIH